MAVKTKEKINVIYEWEIGKEKDGSPMMMRMIEDYVDSMGNTIYKLQWHSQILGWYDVNMGDLPPTSVLRYMAKALVPLIHNQG